MRHREELPFAMRGRDGKVIGRFKAALDAAALCQLKGPGHFVTLFHHEIFVAGTAVLPAHVIKAYVKQVLDRLDWVDVVGEFGTPQRGYNYPRHEPVKQRVARLEDEGYANEDGSSPTD
jgi:hypothetical protein